MNLYYDGGVFLPASGTLWREDGDGTPACVLALWIKGNTDEGRVETQVLTGDGDWVPLVPPFYVTRANAS